MPDVASEVERGEQRLGVDAPKSVAHDAVEPSARLAPASPAPAADSAHLDAIDAEAQRRLDAAWANAEDVLERLREEDRQGGEDA